MTTGAELTAQIPQRWPYAPVGSRIRLVPGHTFAGDWGGRWDYGTLTAYINATLPPHIRDAIIAHELGHGRWSVPLPDLPGEEGSTAIALEMINELHVEYLILQHAPQLRESIRRWIAATAPGEQGVRIRNHRGAAIYYGTFMGRTLTGALANTEVAELATDFRTRHGLAWCEIFDNHLVTAVSLQPGDIGSMVSLARRWDWDATHPPLILSRN